MKSKTNKFQFFFFIYHICTARSTTNVRVLHVDLDCEADMDVRLPDLLLFLSLASFILMANSLAYSAASSLFLDALFLLRASL